MRNQFHEKKDTLDVCHCPVLGLPGAHDEECPGQGQLGLELTESVPVSTNTDFRSK